MNSRQNSHKWLSLLLVLGTAGCQAVTELLPPVPRLDKLFTKPQSPLTAVQSPTIAEMEAAIRQQINEIRTENNLNPLEHNERLAQVARQYSQRMAQENFFSHTGPNGDTPAQRVRDGGIIYLMVGENLFRSTNISNPVPAAVQGWMDSPGHRENILRSIFAETGVGIWREGNQYYITQMFLRSLL